MKHMTLALFIKKPTFSTATKVNITKYESC